MRKYIVFLLVLSAALAPTFGTLAAQPPYQPMIAKIVEVSAPLAPAPNATGATTFVVGFPTVQYVSCSGTSCQVPPVPYVTSIVPAFPPLTLGCGTVITSAQLAQALANGMNVQSGAVGAGYLATADVGSNRVRIVGPPIPGQVDFWIAVFHGEIHQMNGHPLELGRPIVNLCDGVLGNEWGTSSTGLGFDAKLTTLPEDPAAIGSFEHDSGFVIPPNWSWDGAGQVSVEPNGFHQGPVNGFPTAGNYFLRLSAQDSANPYGNVKLATSFHYNPTLPVIRFSYLWMNGEGGVNLSANDTFIASLEGNYSYVEIVHEDTTTPLSAGIRTVEADLREVLPWVYDGELVTLQFNLWNGCCSGQTVNDSVVFVDDISFAPPQLGEGNGVYPYGSQFRLRTMSWDLIRGPSQMSGADKRVSPTGVIVFDFNLSQWSGPSGFPFFICGSFTPYGSQPLFSLPGEPNIVGLDITNLMVLWQGTWGWGYPMIPYFLPPSIPTDGFYTQAAIVDMSTTNGLRVSNTIRHRLE